MYYINKTVSLPFAEAEQKTIAALKNIGFGILTEIDMQAAMKKKLDKDLRPYKILGACHPEFAYQALQKEYKIGALLPCNVVLTQNEDTSVDISIMDPQAALSIVGNDEVTTFATQVKAMLTTMLEEIG